MKSARILTIFSGLLLLLFGDAAAGELAPGLQQLAQSQSAGETVKVWIKLRPVVTSQQLGSMSAAQAKTRAERHRLAINHFKSEHARAQKPLVERLEKLRAIGKVKAAHAYWIVNVVEAEVTAEELPALAARYEVEFIQPIPNLYLIEPEQPELSSSPGAVGATDNLVYVNAPQAWAAGYTGAGRLVCSFDTGVEGSHEALNGKWKGLDGDSAAAWFDPIFEQTFPHVQGSDWITRNHGTHVVGIMVGHHAAETTGVAPDAQWISAAVIDVGSTVILRAFEWAANPDGDPNTVDDVPDVINHSWGFDRAEWQIGCQNICFEAIDHMEALGIVNIFSAGNSGPAGLTITNPANGDDDSLDCFAVGNLKTTVSPPVIATNSSRGPSDCNGGTKPNVVAPGDSIRSTYSGNTYSVMYGTSMAAPHVSGLVALLRQKNPNATVDKIKQAILTSATAGDPGWLPLPNNAYGWGQIDCMAALDSLAGPDGSISVRVYDFTHAPISAGDTVEGTVVLECLGDAVTEVSAVITGTHPSLMVVHGSAYFGDIPRGDTVRSSDSIRVIVSDMVVETQILSIDMQITASDSVLPAQLHFPVDPPATKSIVTHNTGRIQFSISNFGLYGFGPGSWGVCGPGVGFTFDDGPNELFEAGLMIGTDYTHVSSAVHTYIWEPENDFRVAPGGNMQFLSPGPAAAEQTFSRFNDDNALNPLGIEITQESFADNGANNDFIILRYILKNCNSAGLGNVYIGLFLNWDAGGIWAENVGAYEVADEFIWVAYYRGGNPIHYRGMKLIQGPLATVLTGNEDSLIAIPREGGVGFEMWEKYQALTDGFGSADTYRETPATLYQLMAAGPISFSAGGIDTVTFAVLAGSTFVDITDAASRADSVPTDVESIEDDAQPQTFVLHQNYPNPFNPSTVIPFDLERASRFKLSIYNTMGQLVHEESGRARAGRVSVEWNAGSLASGVYFYKVTAGGYSAARMMTLLK